jgi:dihydroorotate dehydrogenase
MYSFATKILHQLPPETAHDVAIKTLRYLPVKNVTRNLDLTGLAQNLLGLQFPHPIGLAAGFDKHAEVYDKLGKLGFSFIELGTITPRPQPGNPKPRLFRLTEQQAIINRYGFNSKGLGHAINHLRKYKRTCITGINLGKNKDTVKYIDDFLKGAETLLDHADYFTINVSSPNTPGLRDLQTAEALAPIIDGVRAIMQQQARIIPIFVKVSPDMSFEQETTLIEFLTEKAIDGIIISNTTIHRTGIENSAYKSMQGGLSGPSLHAPTTAMLKRAYKITQGRIVLIGCGGVRTGQDAYEKLCAGASLIQLYTSFIYQGPAILRQILTELKTLLARKNVNNIADIVGSDN